MTNKTCIILINYNNHNDTLKCLASITEEVYGKNVIVVDNNSSVPGVDEIKVQFPDTILIKNEVNIGFGRANNVGINWALKNYNCEFVFILNNDTTIKRNAIQLLEKAMTRNIEFGIATPKIVLMDAPDVLWYGGGEIDWKKCSSIIPGYLENSDSTIALKERYVTFASGCAMFFKRKVIEDLGGFDNRFFMYVEDVELCIRAKKSGYKILYCPYSVVYHKGQGSQRCEKKFYPIDHPHNPNLEFFTYHLTKNRIMTIIMHATSKETIWFCCFYFFYQLYKVGQFLCYGKISAIKAFVKGALDAKKEITDAT